MGGAGGAADRAGIMNGAAVAGGFEMRAAFAESHTKRELIARLVGVRIGPDQKQHGADVLLRMPGKMRCIVDARKAGMQRLGRKRAAEQALLKSLVLFR